MPATGRPMHPARATARQTASRTYDGAPCSAGHVTRYTASRACVACQATGQTARRATARQMKEATK